MQLIQKNRWPNLSRPCHPQPWWPLPPPPSHLDIKWMAYYVRGVVERNFNSRPHSNFAALNVAAIYAMPNVPDTHLIITWNQFWQTCREGYCIWHWFQWMMSLSRMWSPVQNAKIKIKYSISTVHSCLKAGVDLFSNTWRTCMWNE